MTSREADRLGPAFDAVLAGLRRGDGAAVARAFGAYNPLLVRYLEARAAGAGEDLAQEVWITVARSVGSFSGGEAGFRSWLFSIARTRAIDHARAARRRPLLVASDDREQAVPVADQHLEALTSREAVAELVRGLPVDQADVVLLRVVGGLPVEEVGRLTGRSPGSVRVMQHRALRKLAERLEREEVTR